MPTKPTYAAASQKIQRIFQRSQTRNAAPLPSGQARTKMPKLSPAQLQAIATTGGWKP